MPELILDAVAGGGSRERGRAPSQFQFFNFHAVSAKMMPNKNTFQ